MSLMAISASYQFARVALNGGLSFLNVIAIRMTVCAILFCLFPIRGRRDYSNRLVSCIAAFTFVAAYYCDLYAQASNTPVATITVIGVFSAGSVMVWQWIFLFAKHQGYFQAVTIPRGKRPFKQALQFALLLVGILMWVGADAALEGTLGLGVVLAFGAAMLFGTTAFLLNFASLREMFLFAAPLAWGVVIVLPQGQLGFHPSLWAVASAIALGVISYVTAFVASSQFRWGLSTVKHSMIIACVPVCATLLEVALGNASLEASKWWIMLFVILASWL